MEKYKIAVVGCGNVGRGAIEAVQASPDMELVGVIELPELIEKAKSFVRDVPVVSDIKELDAQVDVVILAVGSRAIGKLAPVYLNMGINTVDPCDIHGETIMELRKKHDKIAKENNAVSIISAGWDPGTDSIVRTLFEIITPRGITNVDFGPGMSMGHTVAVKAIDGVQNALSVTVPMGMSIHKRMVYIELKPGYDFEKVATAIKNDPYFVHDETHVFQVDDVNDLIDMGHSVHIERKGVSGKTHNQKMSYDMSVINPSATGQVLTSAARASMKQKPGCYSLLEIPIIDFIYGDKEELLLRLI